MRKGRIHVSSTSFTENRSLNGTSSSGPQMFGLPAFLRFLAMRFIIMVVRVSGTVKKCTAWMKPPKISWIQMDHLHNLRQQSPLSHFMIQNVLPTQERLTETANNGTEDRAADGAEDDVGDGILLFVRFEEVCDHAEGDRAAGRADTAQSTTDHDGSEVRCQGHRQLPKVDKTERELEDRPSAEFF